mmetsp:Transcript_9145/g.15135  ORF Transcript_9145/g.15135 Transcript_9145/m.15135 type:complete len:517 (-) Transcript_9145:85-1635(-)
MQTAIAIFTACLQLYSQGVNARDCESSESCIEHSTLLQSRSKLAHKDSFPRHGLTGLERDTPAIEERSFVFVSADAGEEALYNDSAVLDLDGVFPWQVVQEAAGCPIMMEFYASWCPHCVHFAPKYKKFAQRIDDSSELWAYTLAAVDCAAESGSGFCANHSITGYPTVRNYASGATPSGTKNVPYNLTQNETALWNYIVDANKEAVRSLGQQRAKACADVRSKLKHELGMSTNSTQGGKIVTKIPHPNHVWLADQQRALFQSLGAESIRTGVLSSNRALLPSLKAFLQLAARAFPDVDTQRRLAKEVVPLLNNISDRSPQQGDNDLWLKNLAWLEPSKSKNGDEYFGCRGSLPNTRGFPCALWQTFHALLVNANYDRSESAEAGATHIGLSAIIGWIDKFFGCEYCRQNFLEMAEHMKWRKVKTDSEAILWFHKAHNSVNARLKNDSTADPAWPKIQFPGQKACPKCWSTTKTCFDDKLVLDYLRKFYAAGAQWPPKALVLNTGECIARFDQAWG